MMEVSMTLLESITKFSEEKKEQILAANQTIEILNRDLYSAKEEISRLKKENFKLKERLKKKVS